MFDELVAVFRDFRTFLADSFLKRERFFLESSVCVNASRREVWTSLWGRDSYDTAQANHYNIEKVSGQGGVYRISWGEDSVYPVSFLNILETYPGEAFLAEKYFDEEENPEDKQLIAVTLVESDDGEQTYVNHYEYAVGLSVTDKLIASFENRWMLQMFKEHCEHKVSGEEQVQVEVEDDQAFWAAISSAVAFFSCWYFYDLSWAILIMMALVFHEFGHVIGMSFLGINPSGVTMLPFVGKAAILKFPFRSELEHAFCSLMGPAVALLPSSIFFLLYLVFGHVFLGAAAAIFAFVSLLSFLPMYPFGSERVFNGLITALKPEDIFAAFVTSFIIGFTVSVMNGYYILALMIALGGLILYEPGYRYFMDYEDIDMDSDVELMGDDVGSSGVAMSSNGALVVLAGLLVCGWAHGSILYVALSDKGVTSLFGY